MARPKLIHIGYAGEHDARSIVLDISDLRRRWPEAAPVLSVVRPGQAEAYFAERVTVDGDALTWVFTGYDAELAGDGMAQIWMLDGGAMLGMSERIQTRVQPSNGTTIEAGEWHEGFAEQVAQNAARAEKALDELREGIAHGDFKGDPGYTPVKGKDYFDGKDGYTPVKGKDYFDGKDGYTPVKGKDYYDGSDANVTAENITAALGYTPANERKVSELRSDLADKLTQPANAQIGQYFRVASVDEQGHAVLEAVDLPIASGSRAGLVRPQTGLVVDSKTGAVSVPFVNNAEIKNRYAGYACIRPAVMDELTRTTMCDGVGPAWSSEEQDAACDRMGAERLRRYELIEEIVTESKGLVNRIAEPDGTPYAFDCMYVEISGDNAQEAWKQWMLFSNTTSFSETYRVGRAYSATSKWSRILVEKNNGLWRYNSFIFNSEGHATNAPSSDLRIVTEDRDKIRRLYLDGIVEGTTIKIYAIR